MRGSKFAVEGYLEIDHRGSPGTKGVPGGTHYESGTTTCAHCTIPITLDTRLTPQKEWCSNCDAYLCSVCALERKQPGYQHVCFKQLADDILSKEYRKLQGLKL